MGYDMDATEFAARAENIKAKLYRMALLYAGSETMAVDAVDEAIFKGFKAFPKLRQPAFFDTWMTRILINECKKQLRRGNRELSFYTLPETEAAAYDTLPLKEAIRRLPPELKEVVLLRFFSGFTLAETAQSLEIPQGTVVTRQRRALSLLKLELSEEE